MNRVNSIVCECGQDIEPDHVFDACPKCGSKDFEIDYKPLPLCKECDYIGPMESASTDRGQKPERDCSLERCYYDHNDEV